MGIVSSKIVRHEGYEVRKQNWMNEQLSHTLGQIKTDFEQIAFEINSIDFRCGFKTSQDRASFFWQPLTNFPLEVADYLIDYFKDKCIELNYYLYQAADKTNESLGKDAMQRQYYLKPLFRLKPAMEDQSHYGNLFISYNTQGGDFAFMIRFDAYYYAKDNHYSLEKLMGILLR